MAINLVQLNRYVVGGALVALIAIGVVTVSLNRQAVLTTPVAPSLSCSPADIGVLPSHPSMGQNVTLSLGTVTIDTGELPRDLTYRWYVDNGRSLEGNPVTTSYDQAGTYYPLVSVSAPGVQSATCSTELTVAPIR